MLHARCGFADVLDALQRVGGVGTAEDAGSKNDGEGVGRHPVCVLLQRDPETHQKKKKAASIPMWVLTESTPVPTQQNTRAARRVTETENPA